MPEIKVDKCADEGRDSSSETEKTPTAAEHLDLSSMVSTTRGGMDVFASDLKEAYAKAVTTGDLTDLDNTAGRMDEYVAAEAKKASCRAEHCLDLAEGLRGGSRNKENDSAWLEVLSDLQPGPYSQYVLQCLENYASQDGPVRTALLEIQANWQEKYGENILYTAHT